MKKRGRGFSKNQVVVIIVLFAIAIIMNIFSFFIFNPSTTGFGTQATGSVTFEILGPLEINITHPYDNNFTYNYTNDLVGPYTLDLNVTSNQPVSSWICSLYDLRHNEWVYQDMLFDPNITFDAVRWGNQLFVEAKDENGRKAYDNVTFYIWVINTAPILGPINNPIYVCEEGLGVNYDYYAVDADEEYLQAFIDDSQGGRFDVKRLGIENFNRTNMNLYSGRLIKVNDIGLNAGNRSFPVNLSVLDGYDHVDWKSTNITLLEINNPPQIDNIGTQTVWTQGENSTFFQIINVDDVEYDLGWGFLNFSNIIRNSSGDLVDLFNITQNSTHYYINFSALNHVIGNYGVSLCFNDTGLSNPHVELMNECGQNGSTQTTCENFILTITNENRAPTIIDFYPNNTQVINISGGNTAYFNLTKYDPDYTIPDTSWYVNNKLIEYDEGSTLVDEFYLEIGCGVSGNHIIRAEITDGELNDSISWVFNVNYLACSVPGGDGGGGGGGGGVPSCTSLWGCGNWGLCQHAQTSLEIGLLSGQDYRIVEQKCLEADLSEINCGFQIRNCRDFNNCSFSYGKPEEIKWCHYTENPSCFDRVKNCHNGMCELLIDCGGPCKACPSCTDGIKNQGEGAIDCGGPCPWKCKPEIPLIKKKELWYAFAIIALILTIIVIIKLIRVLKYKKGVDAEKKEKTRV